MRVLLTNDDGVGARGLTELRAALVALGIDVTVIAPDGNRSAGSHRVAMDVDLTVSEREEGIYACSGSPADCVRVGLLSLDFPGFDLVVSGINHGANAGEDILYSGTVSAAVESVLLGTPGIAFSQNGDGPEVPFLNAEPLRYPDVMFCASLAWNSLQEHPIPPGCALSVNLPTEAMTSPPELVTVGRRRWDEARPILLGESGPMKVYCPWGVPPRAQMEPGTDFEALSRACAGVSVLSVFGGKQDLLGPTLGPGFRERVAELLESSWPYPHSAR